MIDPRRLRILQAVALHGTVTAAARSLYLSPSAVSQQLSALEREVGLDLFERHGRNIRLTASGTVLAGYAVRVSAILEQAEADLAASALGEVGTVSIAAFPSAIIEVVAPALRTLRISAPHLRAHVTDAEGAAAQRLLAEGHVDVSVSVDYSQATVSTAQEFSHARLYSEPLDALVPSDSDLAASAHVSLSRLAGEVWVTPLPGNPIYDLTLLACQQAGFQPRVESVSNDFRAVGALVGAGAGIALAPRSAIAAIDLPHVSVVPLRGRPPRRHVYVSVRRGTEGHPLVNAVLSALHDHARALEPPRRRPTAAQHRTPEDEDSD